MPTELITTPECDPADVPTAQSIRAAIRRLWAHADRDITPTCYLPAALYHSLTPDQRAATSGPGTLAWTCLGGPCGC